MGYLKKSNKKIENFFLLVVIDIPHQINLLINSQQTRLSLKANHVFSHFHRC